MAKAKVKSTGPSHTLQEIPLDKLVVADANVRRRERNADIGELAQNIERFGLQQPIVVQPRGNQYEILIGQRRYLAARQLGWETISASVRSEPYDERDAKAVSFSENIQRRDLAPRDKADVCEYLYRELGSVNAVAEYVGTTPKTVRKWLGYAGVSDSLKQLVADRKLSVDQATRLSQSVTDEARAVAIAEQISKMKPTTRQRERIVEAAEELGDSPVELILQRADELKIQSMITFILPAHANEPMDKACSALRKRPADIAREATLEWLDTRGYV